MNKASLWIGVAAWVLAWAPLHLRAERCSLESPPHRVPVLELYTSEGCNSCPPADRWLSGLPARGVSADQAVLLAFHVDYWNRLGWPDRFSQPAFSARQREVAARASSGVVYTPQVVLDGRALRQVYSSDALDRKLGAINAERGRAAIRAEVATAVGVVKVSGEVRLADAAAHRDAEVWVALFEQGLSSRVTRGENAGKLLYHDFVVRALTGPFPLASEGRGRIDYIFNLGAEWSAPQLGLAIFVQNRSDGRTLQAVSSYPLCGV